MKRSLYFVTTVAQHEDYSSSPPQTRKVVESNFGIRPYDPKYQSKYDAMTRVVSLTADVGWTEASLQMILRKSDFWEDFPIKGSTLIRAEFKPSKISQRIDLLFLSNTGELVPCELKIRGDYPDAHGQLLRYVADLEFSPWNLARVRDAHNVFVSKMANELVAEKARRKMDAFIETHKIAQDGNLPVRAGGVIIDAAFSSGTRAAVRYLNQRRFAIELIEVRALVSDDWKPDDDDRWMRLDFEAIVL